MYIRVNPFSPIWYISPLTEQGVTYIFQDEFTTADAAPLGSPRNAEPLGTWTVVETDGDLSIATGRLVYPQQASAVWGDQGMVSNSITKVNGLALKILMNNSAYGASGSGYGFNEAASVNWDTTGVRWGTVAAFPALRIALGAVNVDVGAKLTNSTDYELATIITDGGTLHLIKGGTEYPDWTLLFHQNVVAAGTVYASFGNHTNTGDMDYVRATQLAAPFQSHTALATLVQASPVADTVYDSTLTDGIYDLTFTTPAVLTNRQARLRFRQQDTNNFLWFGLGSTNFLARKNVAGVATDYDSGNILVTSQFVGNTTYTVRAIVEGDNFSFFKRTGTTGNAWVFLASGSDNDFNTETDVSPLVAGATLPTLDDLRVYPRTSAAFDALDDF